MPEDQVVDPCFCCRAFLAALPCCGLLFCKEDRKILPHLLAWEGVKKLRA